MLPVKTMSAISDPVKEVCFHTVFAMVFLRKELDLKDVPVRFAPEKSHPLI